VILIASDLTGQIFNRLKTIPGLSASHFQLVLTDHLNGIDLSNPYQHDNWDYYMDIALGIICRRKPVDQLHKCLLSLFCFNCFFYFFPFRICCELIYPTSFAFRIFSGLTLSPRWITFESLVSVRPIALINKFSPSSNTVRIWGKLFLFCSFNRNWIKIKKQGIGPVAVRARYQLECVEFVPGVGSRD
jgi:hypothetical protein